jgi:hypothetical protein
MAEVVQLPGRDLVEQTVNFLRQKRDREKVRQESERVAQRAGAFRTAVRGLAEAEEIPQEQQRPLAEAVSREPVQFGGLTKSQLDATSNEGIFATASQVVAQRRGVPVQQAQQQFDREILAEEDRIRDTQRRFAAGRDEVSADPVQAVANLVSRFRSETRNVRGQVLSLKRQELRRQARKAMATIDPELVLGLVDADRAELTQVLKQAKQGTAAQPEDFLKRVDSILKRINPAKVIQQRDERIAERAKEARQDVIFERQQQLLRERDEIERQRQIEDAERKRRQEVEDADRKRREALEDAERKRREAIEDAAAAAKKATGVEEKKAEVETGKVATSNRYGPKADLFSAARQAVSGTRVGDINPGASKELPEGEGESEFNTFVNQPIRNMPGTGPESYVAAVRERYGELEGFFSAQGSTREQIDAAFQRAIDVIPDETERARVQAGFDTFKAGRGQPTAGEIPGTAATEPRIIQGSALSGEVGVQQRPGGGVSTELSITVEDERLNDGKPTNIPLLVANQINIQSLLRGAKPSREQVNIAIARAAERVAGGETLPSFNTVEEAVAAAKKRSAAGGSLPDTRRATGAETPFERLEGTIEQIEHPGVRDKSEALRTALDVFAQALPEVTPEERADFIERINAIPIDEDKWTDAELDRLAAIAGVLP